MNEIVEFVKENYLNIGIIVTIVLVLLVIMSIKGINLNQKNPDSKLVQQVTVETFADKGRSMDDSEENIEKLKLNPVESFCESYLGNSSELETACNELTETNCAQTKCCVFTNSKCVAGDLNGPTYKTDANGKLITLDTYYYLGKCNGKCPV